MQLTRISYTSIHLQPKLYINSSDYKLMSFVQPTKPSLHSIKSQSWAQRDTAIQAALALWAGNCSIKIAKLEKWLITARLQPDLWQKIFLPATTASFPRKQPTSFLQHLSSLQFICTRINLEFLFALVTHLRPRKTIFFHQANSLRQLFPPR